MTECNKCNKEIKGCIPFTCKYCNKINCSRHRLPEDHNCKMLSCPKKPFFINKPAKVRHEIKVEQLERNPPSEGIPW